MRKAVGYVRVSTKQQGASGLGIEAQRAAVQQLAAARGLELAAVHTDVESGRRARPELERALQHCRAEGAALVVARLDRLGRRPGPLYAIRDSGITVAAGDMPEGLGGPAQALLFATLAGVAEAEALATSDRTRAALAAARARGVKLGGARPEAAARGRAAQQERARAWAETLRLLVDHLDREAGHQLPPAQLARDLAARGAKAPRGGARWSFAQARRLRELLSGTAH